MMKAGLLRVFIASCVLLLLVSCDTEDGDGKDNPNIMDAPSTGQPGYCSQETRVGSLKIDMQEAYPSITGSFADGVVPIDVLHLVEGGSDGDCILEQRIVPSCDDICTPQETCGFDGECMLYPQKHSVGEIVIGGLDVPVSMEPTGDPGFLRYSFIDLESPFIEPGAPIVAQAAGDPDDFSGFTLHGSAVEYMEVPPGEMLLEKDTDLEINWTMGNGDARITIIVNIDQHGASPTRLFCETADTGSYSVASSQVNKLMDAGVTGFPSITMKRRTIEKTTLPESNPGCIEFEVSSALTRVIKVEGHIPCHNDTECPDGMECDIENETCVSVE